MERGFNQSNEGRVFLVGRTVHVRSGKDKARPGKKEVN